VKVPPPFNYYERTETMSVVIDFPNPDEVSDEEEEVLDAAWEKGYNSRHLVEGMTYAEREAFLEGFGCN